MESIKARLKQNLTFSDKPGNESASMLNQRGIRYAEAGDLAQAERYYRKAIQKDKKFKNAYYNLVILYELKKEYHNAVNIFNDFSLYYPEDERMNSLMEKVLIEINKKNKSTSKTKEEFLSR